MACHVDPHGQLLSGDANARGWLDAGVFHKGTAVVRDDRGWFAVNRLVDEVLPHAKRFDQLEPFYNGHAFAVDFDGRHCVISEAGETLVAIDAPATEHARRAAHLATSHFPALSVRVGLQSGPDDYLDGRAEWQHSRDLFEALVGAWAELGLVRRTRTPREGVTTWEWTEYGRFLARPNGTTSPLGDRVRYWLADQIMNTWRAPTTDVNVTHDDFFTRVSHDNAFVALMARTLEGYAREDYEGIVQHVEVPQRSTIVDVGGGTGSLLRAVLAQEPTANGILVERAEVVEHVITRSDRALPFECFAADMLNDELPLGNVSFCRQKRRG